MAGDRLLLETLREGWAVLERPGCTEQDAVYHLLAPFLQACGWRRLEIYFEKAYGRSTPDVALIPEGMNEPVLALEAKGVRLDLPSLAQGDLLPVQPHLDKTHPSVTR